MPRRTVQLGSFSQAEVADPVVLALRVSDRWPAAISQRSASTQLNRRSDGRGRWKRCGWAATSAARSSLGNAKPISVSSSENAT